MGRYASRSIPKSKVYDQYLHLAVTCKLWPDTGDVKYVSQRCQRMGVLCTASWILMRFSIGVTYVFDSVFSCQGHIGRYQRHL